MPLVSSPIYSSHFLKTLSDLLTLSAYFSNPNIPLKKKTSEGIIICAVCKQLENNGKIKKCGGTSNNT